MQRLHSHVQLNIKTKNTLVFRSLRINRRRGQTLGIILLVT
jgi:hypothetical protein